MADNLFSSPGVTITVSELNRCVRALLESAIPLFWVSGEISNLTRASSGHWYFSLKDTSAQVRCVMFRNRNAYLEWQPREGDQVEARALVSLYEARGEFQLTIETLRQAGAGKLFEAFERLKAKLLQEGLFDSTRKRPLPTYPRQIGIVTSTEAAALHDVVTTLARRMPNLPVIIYPTPVQGKDAAEKIAQAITTASGRNECDVLIVCRGGGSLEDLWSFNEEIVARAIASCRIPVISGIGHETDITIADFAADVRAPTPTAAAEMACKDSKELIHQLSHMGLRFNRQIQRGLYDKNQTLDYLSRRLIHPGEKIRGQQASLIQISAKLRNALNQQLSRAQVAYLPFPTRLKSAMTHMLTLKKNSLENLNRNLAHLNPKNVLNRGYSLIHKQDGVVVRSSNQLHEKDQLTLTFAQGTAKASVINTTLDHETQVE